VQSGSSGRIIYAVSIYYLLRALVQGLFTFKFPAYNYWQSPGLPSLLVPYGKNSDFYPSGHTGFTVMITRECWLRERSLYKLFSMVFFLFYVITILIVYRQHYAIDIVIGFIYGLWMHVTMQRLAPWLDRHISRIFMYFKHRFNKQYVQASEKTRTVESTLYLILVVILTKP
jgi:hypothetical protein